LSAPRPASRFARLRAVPLLLALLALALLASAGTASAATFTVDDATDAALTNPAGTSCSSTNGGSCTLRAAVQAADNTGGANTITLPAGDFKLTIPSTGQGDPSTGDLDIKGGVEVTIAGAGAGVSVIDANHIDRAFAVLEGASLSISGVTIEHGDTGHEASEKSTKDGYGGAIYNDGALSINSSLLTGNTSYDGGGAIYSDTEASSTSITNSTVTRNAADDGGGVLIVYSGSINLTNDTLTNNSADEEGGVVYAEETGSVVGTVTVAGSTMSDNTADDEGGAMYLEYAGPTSVTSSTFSANNTDDDEGGAIYDYDSGRLTVQDSTFSANTAGDDDGGAVYTDDTDLTVASSAFSSNEGEEGGAIYVDGSSSAAKESIEQSSFNGNHATDDEGGAIYDDYGNLSIAGSTFTQNSASYYAGALYYDSGDALSLVNDTLDSNQAQEGGAIYFDTEASTGAISLLNDTIVRNTGYYGGGIAYPYYANSIENSIIAENTGTLYSLEDGGGDCYYSVGYDKHTADRGNNIDSDGTCFGGLGVPGDQIGVDPLVAPLAANGGPVETDALLAGSPAIGKADGSACPPTDARGVPRPSGSCDVGAYQTGLPPSIAIASPLNGATYTQGQVVAASYGCSAPAGASVTSCTGPVASAAAIDTSTLGVHTFTVNAEDSEFASASQSASYTVVAGKSPAPAVIPPIISELKQTAKVWREGNALAQYAVKKASLGTTFSFRLNEPASVTFTFTEQVGGRKVGGKCVASTKKNSSRQRCARTVIPGTLTFSAHAGTNKVRFEGLISKTRKLGPGLYTLHAVAAASGEHSTTKTLSFKIAAH
jgi:predicted outer membrane repeat protein